MFLLEKIPQIRIIQDLARKRKLQVHLVGGYLRDHFLGIEKTDLDFAVSKDALKLAEIFAGQIKGAYIVLDQERGCARVAKKEKGAILTFDFADFRAKGLKADLSLRDFTINTLSVDILKLSEGTDIKDLIADEKNGSADLKRKVIRMVSSGGFIDDPLRVLRAFSLRASLGFTIESKTIKQIQKDKHLLKDVSAERIREELFKILASANTYETFVQMDKLKVLELIIPQLQVMFDCEQGGYHHLDVWKHSLEAIRQFEELLKEVKDDVKINEYLLETISSPHTRRDIIKLALLLHDIGKPETRKKEKERYTFHGHEHVGKYIARNIARMLRFSSRERYALEDMVLWHLRPGYLSNFAHPTKKAVFRFFRDAKEEAASILLLSLADQRATRGTLSSVKEEKHHREICQRLLKEFFHKKQEKPIVRLITGDDLIKKLKLKPSPLFKKILSAVEEKQALGKIVDKKQALELARKIANKS